MALPSFLKVQILKSALGSLQGNHDLKTTVLGVAASGILAANIDYNKLFTGDGGEIGKLAGVVIGVVFSYYTNKPQPTEKQ